MIPKANVLSKRPMSGRRTSGSFSAGMLRYNFFFFFKLQCRHVRDQIVSFPVGLFHDRKQVVEKTSDQITLTQRASCNKV